MLSPDIIEEICGVLVSEDMKLAGVREEVAVILISCKGLIKNIKQG